MMNKAPPYGIGDIVRLDSHGLPMQIWRTNEFSIGPAFKTEAESIEADKLRHTAQVFVHDVDGKVMLTWWEASQSGLPERLGHTEQKALLRIRLRRGLYLLIQGTHPCCPYGTGCLNALADLAELHDCVFDYRAARGKRHLPLRTNRETQRGQRTRLSLRSARANTGHREATRHQAR